MYSDRIIAWMTAFPCMLYQRLQVQFNGHLCAVHDVADTVYVGVLTTLQPDKKPSAEWHRRCNGTENQY